MVLIKIGNISVLHEMYLIMHKISPSFYLFNPNPTGRNTPQYTKVISKNK